jgi:hypothetical protein
MKTQNREMLAEKQKLKIKMAEIHKCTSESFKRVSHIFQNSNNDIEKINALNNLSNSTYIASIFHLSMEKELEKKDNSLSSDFKNLREEQKNSFIYEKHFLDERLTEYINYYEKVLNGEPCSTHIPLVESGMSKNEEFDKKSLKKFMNNYARNARDNEVIFGRIDEDPYKNDYYEEKSKFDKARQKLKNDHKDYRNEEINQSKSPYPTNKIQSHSDKNKQNLETQSRTHGYPYTNYNNHACPEINSSNISIMNRVHNDHSHDKLQQGQQFSQYGIPQNSNQNNNLKNSNQNEDCEMIDLNTYDKRKINNEKR